MKQIVSIPNYFFLALAMCILFSCDGGTATSSEGKTNDPASQGPDVKGDFGIPWVSTISYGSATDARDNQVYRTVKIGTQTWMAENLNYKPTGADSGWCFGNRADSCSKYGRLYTWATAMKLPASCNRSLCASQVQTMHQGVCPAGWHVPSDAEWATLAEYTGGDALSGRNLKSLVGWGYPGIGEDKVGFRAIPAGFRYDAGGFGEVGTDIAFWTANETTGPYAKYRFLFFEGDKLGLNSYYKQSGYSVRCLKDSP